MKTNKPRPCTNDRSKDQRSETPSSRQARTNYSSQSISGMRTVPANVPSVGMNVQIPAGLRIRFHHEVYERAIDRPYFGVRYI